MNDPLALVLDRLRGAGCDPRQTGDGYAARCPSHEDRSPSLSVGTGDDGRVLVHCHAGCTHAAVVAALQLKVGDLFPADGARPAPRPTRPTSEKRPFPTLAALVADVYSRRLPPTAHWLYQDRAGENVGVVFRLDPPGRDKYFTQGRREADGSWIEKAMPRPRPLYRLPAVLSSTGPIWVCEGEKAADALVSIGLEATTSPGGCKAARFGDWSSLAGRAAVIVPDHDEPGEGYRADVEQLARAAGAASVLVVRLVDLWPDLPAGGDAHDWIEAHDAIEPDALRDRLVRAAAEAADKVVIEAAPAVASATTPATATTSAPPAAVARLVSLSDAIERWRKQERPPVVETGFTPLDRAGGGGLPVGGLTVFAGAPGVGKSALALQATLGALHVDPTLRAIWGAGEMTIEGIVRRAVANWAAGPANRNVSMKGAADHTNAALEVAADLEAAVGDRLHFLPAPLQVDDITDVVTATGSTLLVVDYLQLVEVVGATDRRHAVDAVLNALKNLALQHAVAVVCISNVAKGVGPDAHAGQIGKESSGIGHSADVFFHGVEAHTDADGPGRPVRWIAVKARNEDRVDMNTTFNGSQQWFDHEATVEPHDEFAAFAPAGGKAR